MIYYSNEKKRKGALFTGKAVRIVKKNCSDYWSDLKTVALYLVTFTKWTFLACLMGIIGGTVGSLFSKAITAVTELRQLNGWLLYLLPLGGVVIVGIYALCKVEGLGTNRVFESVRSGKNVPLLLTPSIFAGSCITHLLGGSAGREGAALQLGGSIASGLGKLFRMGEKSRHILVMTGMSALFSAVFGTPLCAAVFAVEVVSVGYIYTSGLYPCLVSSLSAYFVSKAFGIKGEHFTVDLVPDVDIVMVLRVAAVAAVAAVVSIVFCKAMHGAEHIFSKIKNPYLRAVIGGAIIICLSLLVGSDTYNGGGIHIIEDIFHNGTVIHEAFLLKIVFTAITIASGYKGGEIVPTLFIGATLGSSIGYLVGLPVPFSAALGIAAMFCGVTNCPLATVLLCLELFGAEGLIFYVLAAFMSFLLSGYYSLYTGQKIVFPKLSDDTVNINGH